MASERCLGCGCLTIRHAQGRCVSCYNMAMRRGEITLVQTSGSKANVASRMNVLAAIWPMSVAEKAERLGVSERTVMRYQSRMRESS